MKGEVNRIPGSHFFLDGERHLYFGGTSYLGMQTLRKFRELQSRLVSELGTHWGASRGGNIALSVYREAEERIAAWSGSPAACTLSSGFLAGRLLVESFAGPEYQCFFSPNCHAALLPPGRQRHADWSEFKQALNAHIEQDNTIQAVVFTDTISFDEGPQRIEARLEELPKEQLLLVADDSHGLGIFGFDGTGAYKDLNKIGFKELIVCASMGKAMGVTAGVVLGESSRIESLMQHPLFLGASPAPPAALGSLAHALKKGWYKQQHSLLLEQVAYFLKGTAHLPFLHSMEGYPVSGFRSVALAEFLMRNRIIITHFAYAAEASTSSPSRIVLTAAHNRQELDCLIRILNDSNKSQQLY
jgi:7-keto-8-aminopelargonate synthetase-like enzyme